MSLKGRLNRLLAMLPKPEIDNHPILLLPGQSLANYPKTAILIICKDQNQRSLIAGLKIGD